jgi:hypothetical protein
VNPFKALELTSANAEVLLQLKENLNITSHHLRKHFQNHNICPSTDPEYSHFFSIDEPDIALTYEWSISFTHIFKCLSSGNIRAHNRAARDPNPSLCERLYWMSYVWVFLGPLAKLPEDIGERTIWIDILFNNQNNKNIVEELAEAENR